MKTKNWNFKKEFEAQKAGEKLELASSFFCFQIALFSNSGVEDWLRSSFQFSIPLFFLNNKKREIMKCIK